MESLLAQPGLSCTWSSYISDSREKVFLPIKDILVNDLSKLNLSTARCRQFIARFMCMGLKANSQFIQVILWKILLPLSETTGYKNTGHNSNFSSGILSIIRVQNSSQAFIGNINREINYTMTKPIELFNTMFFFVTIGFPGISLCSLITLRWFLVS